MPLVRSAPRFRLVFDEIRNHILANGLRPGDKLPSEAELSQRFRASRISVREALKGMEALGIIEARHGIGFYVRDFSFDTIAENLPSSLMFDRGDLADLLEVRMVLECAFVRRAAARIESSTLDELADILERMGERARSGEQLGEVDREFHVTVYRDLGNAVVIKQVAVFWNLLQMARDKALLLEAYLESTYLDHVRIYGALANRDPDEAEVCMRKHFEGIEARVLASK